MYNHAPVDYECPFCLAVAGRETERMLTRQQDIVYRDQAVTAFIASHWWPNNSGHVLIIPNAHYENIYDLPLELGGAIHSVAQQIAIAFKTSYHCDGVSTRQHNESAGNQEVWHYHLHIFPRYTGDNLYAESRILTTPDQRWPYAEKLRKALGYNPLAENSNLETT
jgi:histidine triad (HIT) family protein